MAAATPTIRDGGATGRTDGPLRRGMRRTLARASGGAPLHLQFIPDRGA
jgi:hypothetical protein